MTGNAKQFLKILAGMVALGLTSLACAKVSQAVQQLDCVVSGGDWRYNSHYSYYYCENAGSEYDQKYSSSTETPIASSEPETSPSNTQDTSSSETTSPLAESSPTDLDSPTITGLWYGTAQWLCDTSPAWSTTLDFGSNGSVSATVSNTSDTASSMGTWDISGNEIRIQFERGVWAGTISENTISGTFAEENCAGVWSVTKE